MKLTREQAIDRSIELWEWLAETGKLKEDWLGWANFGGINEFKESEEVDCECFLCEYGEQQCATTEGKCSACPYVEVFGDCCNEGAPFTKWYNLSMPFYRKKYAALFLEQLKELKK